MNLKKKTIYSELFNQSVRQLLHALSLECKELRDVHNLHQRTHFAANHTNVNQFLDDLDFEEIGFRNWWQLDTREVDDHRRVLGQFYPRRDSGRLAVKTNLLVSRARRSLIGQAVNLI